MDGNTLVIDTTDAAYEKYQAEVFLKVTQAYSSTTATNIEKSFNLILKEQNKEPFVASENC